MSSLLFWYRSRPLIRHYEPVESASDTASEDGQVTQKEYIVDERLDLETRPKRRSTLIRYCLVGLVTYLLGFASFLGLSKVRSNSCVAYATDRSPAQHAASYEHRIAYPVKEQEILEWRGLPTQEVTDFWTEISNYKTMVLSREQLERAGQNVTGAVELKTGGFLSLLGVFHELHCVDEVRKFIYKGVYYPDMTPEDEIDKISHIDHCIDILRESISCTGDLTVYHYEIMRTSKGPKARVLTNTARQCLKLDGMIEFVRSTQKGNEVAIGVPVVP